MQSLIQQAIRMCDTFGQIMCNRTLNEFEVLMYEKVCGLVQAYAVYTEIQVRMQQMDLEKAEREAQRLHQQWLEKNSGTAEPKYPEGGDSE